MTTARRLIQSLYDAFAQGDIETVLGSFASNIEWLEAKGNPLADGNPYDSPSRIGAEVFGRLVGLFDGYAAVPESFVAEDEQVVVFGRYLGTHRESGQRLDAPFVHHWTVTDNKVSHFRQYTDTAQMVRLVG